MCSGGGDYGAGAARQAEEARQARIKAGMTSIDDTFNKFGDDYYKTQSKAYTNFATPQLEDQYRTARENATYDLARSGNLNSSTGARALSDLQREYALQRETIAGKALDVANSTRQNVESNRNDLTALLYQTGDNENTAREALNRAASVNTPSFSPLGQLFQNFTKLASIDQTAQTYGFPGYRGGGSGKGSATVIK